MPLRPPDISQLFEAKDAEDDQKGGERKPRRLSISTVGIDGTVSTEALDVQVPDTPTAGSVILKDFKCLTTTAI